MSESFIVSPPLLLRWLGSVPRRGSASVAPPNSGGQERVRSWCWCYVKMSWGNCYVKVSCPHGDFHVEPEGVASSRTVEGGRRGPDHQWPSGDGAASQCPTGPATQGALPGWGGPRPAAWQSRAAVASTAGRGRARADRALDEDGVRGLQRHAPDGA